MFSVAVPPVIVNVTEFVEVETPRRPPTLTAPRSMIVVLLPERPTELPVEFPTLYDPADTRRSPATVGDPLSDRVAKFGLLSQRPPAAGIVYPAVVNSESIMAKLPEILSVPLVSVRNDD
jgi:hypothetical protein